LIRVDQQNDFVMTHGHSLWVEAACGVRRNAARESPRL